MGVTLLALARFTLRGPVPAAAVVGVLAVLAVTLPSLLDYTPASMVLAFVATVIAAILVGLIILTQGLWSGVRVIAASLAGIVLVTWVLLDSPQEVIKVALVYWLPIIALAQALRLSKSLAFMLLAGLAIAAFGVLMQQLLWGDMESMWIAQMVEQGDSELTEEAVTQLRQLVKLLMLLFVPSLYLLTTLCMMAARWTEVRMVAAAGFDREFQAMQFGRATALAALVLTTLFFWWQQPWMLSTALLLVLAFMYQGIAVAHSRLAKKNMPTIMFIMFYLLLVMFSQFTVVVMAITGLVDNWLDIRSLRTSATKLDQ